MMIQNDIRDLFREILGISDFQWEGNNILDGMYREVCTIDEFKVMYLNYFEKKGWKISVSDGLIKSNFYGIEITLYEKGLQAYIDMGIKILDYICNSPEALHLVQYSSFINGICETQYSITNHNKEYSSCFVNTESEELGTPPKGRSQKAHNNIMKLNKRKW